MNIKLKRMFYPQRMAGTAAIVACLLSLNSPIALAAGGAKLNGVNAVQQSAQTIKGKIVDENGEPVIGASVVEKGTRNGVVTDLDGNFVITVSKTEGG